MAEYQLVMLGDQLFNGVRRVSDGAMIRAPSEQEGQPLPGQFIAVNPDWVAYQEWLAAGNEPDPVPPPPRPEPVPLEPVRVADPESDVDAVNRRYLMERLGELSDRIDGLEEATGRAAITGGTA